MGTLNVNNSVHSSKYCVHCLKTDFFDCTELCTVFEKLYKLNV